MRVVIFAALCLLAACGLTLAADKNVSFVTFNAGLYEPYNPFVSIRRNKLYEALDTLNDDVICVQGVNRVFDQREIISRFRARNYSYLSYVDASLPATPSPRACANYNTTALGECLLTISNSCSSIFNNITNTLDIESAFTCLVSGAAKCRVSDLLKAENSACAVCVIEQMPIMGMSAFPACNNDSTNRWEANYQLLLLSKSPLFETAKLLMDGNSKAGLYATINTKSTLGLLGVGCVLPSGRTKYDNYIAFPSPYTTYVAENVGQVKQFLNLMVTKRPARVVMGDFLFGRGSADLGTTAVPIVAEYSENYAEVFASYTNFYTNSTFNNNINCTTCADNNINSLSYFPRANMLTSHIVFGGVDWTTAGVTPARVQTERVFDKPILLNDTFSGYVSPNFAIRVRLTVAESNVSDPTSGGGGDNNGGNGGNGGNGSTSAATATTVVTALVSMVVVLVSVLCLNWF